MSRPDGLSREEYSPITISPFHVHLRTRGQLVRQAQAVERKHERGAIYFPIEREELTSERRNALVSFLPSTRSAFIYSKIMRIRKITCLEFFGRIRFLRVILSKQIYIYTFFQSMDRLINFIRMQLPVTVSMITIISSFNLYLGFTFTLV